jgi:hypothetical protein
MCSLVAFWGVCGSWGVTTGIFGFGSKLQHEEAQRTRRLAQSRSYVQESFGMTTEKGTDLKRKSYSDLDGLL